ncbi:hypothetical protein GQ44DRAFT_829589 [Phaeosphaeriaceae sp. PMI808]|nr:hypothetical protein GQ44DRAFT_829589 [Phaeosphaeriaceae sp. PMI808]
MSHSEHGSMGMGSVPLPALREFPNFYWAVVGSAVGVAAMVNLYTNVLCKQRIHATRAGVQNPAKPRSWFALWNATIFALTREASNYSLRIPLKSRILRFPSVGRLSLVLANLITLLVLCSYGLDLNGRFTREDVAFRCGVVTVSQLPQIFLLAGKNNIVGYLTGMSYERLNWLHRWCARTMLLTATLHMGYFFRLWAPYDYIGYKLKNDGISWKGLAAWSTLVWIVFSSMTPIRGWCYELFVIQHLMSFAVLTGFVWKPGQHVFLSCHSVVPLQSHPFTVASIPEDGVMEFLIKSETGGTRRFLRHAEKTHGLSETPQNVNEATELLTGFGRGRTVTIEGPYGCLRPLRQFDTVVLFAGSTGVTFTLPLLCDIVQGWRENTATDTRNSHWSLFKRQPGAVTRHARFVWVIKGRGQLSWLSEQLSSISTEFQALQERLRDIKLELTIYITCDEAFTEEHRTLISTIATPGHNVTAQNNAGHGLVQYRARHKAIVESSSSEKDIIEGLTTVASEKADGGQEARVSNGTCCCRTEVDESAQPDNVANCCCSPSPNKTAEPDSTIRPLSRLSSSPPTSLKQKFPLHPSITLYAGRPKTRDIIRRSLEQALGESAVVVCGPRGLIADVQYDVCSLSDERAVHKGTGAQGIYLHTESFNY